MKESYEEDEAGVLQALAELGSVSASILVYLELSREVVSQAFHVLRDERAAQTNLADILGATRYRVYHRKKLYHTKCPKRHCYSRDSFLHMLECYHLIDRVRRGAEAVPFLVTMARLTQRRRGQIVFPYIEALTAVTRAQDSALRGATMAPSEESDHAPD